MRRTLLLTTALMASAFLGYSLMNDGPNNLALAQSTSNQSEGTKEASAIAKYFDYDTFTLENGLRVIVHEDRSTPSVAVTSLIQVGSQNEPDGKSGFAHLFEHLLFNGTPNAPGEFFNYLEELGATNKNGTTSLDKTDYYQTVPTGALERMLWLEADRMTNLMRGVSEKSLQTQIDVVKNEKGLIDNEPFGATFYDTIKYLYPPNHPYSHSVIGSIEDLEAASLEDVRKWHRDYYGARNMVLSLAGDIDVETAKKLVPKYFDQMQSGPGISRASSMTVKRDVNTKQTATDIAPNSGYERHYLLPADSSYEGFLVKMAADMFSSGEAAILTRELVDKRGLALQAYGSVESDVLNSTFVIYATPKDGVSLDEISAAIDEIIADFIRQGPSRDDIARFKGDEEAALYFTASDTSFKASALGEGLLYHDDPHSFLKPLKWMEQANKGRLQEAADEWLSNGYHEVYKIAEEEGMTPEPLPASAKPPVIPTPKYLLKEPNVFTLKNGLKVVHLKRSNIPNISFQFEFPLGEEDLEEEGRINTEMMISFLGYSSAGKRSRTDVAQKLKEAGLNLQAYTSKDFTALAGAFESPKSDLSFGLIADMLTSSHYKDIDVEYARDFWMQSLRNNLNDPLETANDRLFNEVSGEQNHSTILEKLKAWETVSRQQLIATHDNIFRPDGARLFIVGDISEGELKKRLESIFKGWDGASKASLVNKVISPANPKQPRFILVNKEGSSQTNVAGIRNINLEDKDNFVKSIFNEILGGGFTSRINLNIREDKGWTYGIGTRIDNNNIVPNWGVMGTVTAKHTVDTIRELNTEITNIMTVKPTTDVELTKTVDPHIKGFSSTLSDNYQIVDYYSKAAALGEPYTYANGQDDRYQSITVKDIKTVIPGVINKNDMTWLLVGNLSIFEDELRAANLGKIEVFDCEAPEHVAICQP